MTRQVIALAMCAVLLSGCVRTGGPRIAMAAPPQATAQRPAADPAIMAEYVQKLPLGTRVRVDRASGPVIRGTLMKATAESIIVQPRTRIPEPPIEIPLRDIVAVTPEASNGNIGKAIGIGAAAGAAAALGVILILILAFSD